MNAQWSSSLNAVLAFAPGLGVRNDAALTLMGDAIRLGLTKSRGYFGQQEKTSPDVD